MIFIGKIYIVLVYVDDCVIFSKKGYSVVDRLIKSIKEGNDNFEFVDEGDLKR